MKHKFHRLNSQSGFSLAELLIVIIIIAVVATLAYMKMGTANTQFQRQNVARELKVAFERARFDSVKRDAEGAARAKVDVNPSTYVLWIDANNDGTLESTTFDFAAGNIVIDASGTTTVPVTVYFDKRGEVTTTGAGFQFLVCNVSCSTPTSANADLVIVTATGTVNLLGGAATPPAFNSPIITNTPMAINTLVTLPTP
jgi:prepilin-type N-terminal cleavage/methylation domain-containing protein